MHQNKHIFWFATQFWTFYFIRMATFDWPSIEKRGFWCRQIVSARHLPARPKRTVITSQNVNV